MIAKTAVAVCLLFLAFRGSGEDRSSWKRASENDPGIEFQWTRPAKNSCEIFFRDLQLKSRTTLNVAIQYLPHKSAKQNVARDSAQLVLGTPGAESKHLLGCEEIAGVMVSDITRE
jgi:hypothetical protein